MDVWEVRKQILYGNDACPSRLHPSPRLGIWGVSLELMGRGVVSWTNEVSLSMSMYINFGANSCACMCVFL